MTEDMLRSLAATLQHWPEVVARLRAEHRAGPDGRCLGCTSQVRPSPRWPCGLATIAMPAQGRAAQGPGRPPG